MIAISINNFYKYIRDHICYYHRESHFTDHAVIPCVCVVARVLCGYLKSTAPASRRTQTRSSHTWLWSTVRAGACGDGGPGGPGKTRVSHWVLYAPCLNSVYRDVSRASSWREPPFNAHAQSIGSIHRNASWDWCSDTLSGFKRVVVLWNQNYYVNIPVT